MTKITHLAEKNWLGKNPDLTEYDLNVQERNLDLVDGDSLSLYLRQAVPPRGRSTRSNKSKKAYPDLKPVKTVKMSDSEWLNSAIADETRPESIQVAHKNWAADGFRMHIIENVGDCNCKYCKNRKSGHEPMSPDYKVVIPIRFKAEFTLERDAWLNALNVCRVIAREGSNVVRIDAKANDIMFSSYFEEIGQTMVTYSAETTVRNYLTGDKIYHYSKTGENFLIGFNVNFVLDAVKAMGEIITFKFSHKTNSAILTDGKRTAVLMPMNLG